MLEDVFEESDDSVGDSIESLSYSLENAVPQQEVFKVFPLFFLFLVPLEVLYAKANRNS